MPEPPEVLRHFAESYRKFKEEIGKIDFADQIERFLRADEPLDIDVLFVDEAQDLSRVQWRVVDLLSRSASKVYIAGDDKQSIYEFSGGDPEALINRDGERIVLGTCYRLPDRILAFAENVASRISSKTPYTVTPSVTGGEVTTIHNIRNLDLSKGTWLFLSRNRAYLEYFEAEVLKLGYLFKSLGSDAIPTDLLGSIAAWRKICSGGSITGSEAKTLYGKYLPTGVAVSRGFKKVMQQAHDDDEFDFEDLRDEYGLLTQSPWDQIFPVGSNLRARIIAADKRDGLADADRIEITTIHSTKGREADNVVVLPDMTWTTFTAFQNNPDTEHRTFYVAASRAKERLFLHQPLTENHYVFPASALPSECADTGQRSKEARQELSQI
jgi:DNA helicase-2/ATP-dependent DNA helicase PcrA